MAMLAGELFDDKVNVSLVDDPIEEYRKSLSDLTMNSKPMILMLTMLAEDYKDTKAAEIVSCIEQRLYQVKTDQKLPTLYLLDSICKNVNVTVYIPLFEKKIVKMFCHTFERSDEKTRISLFKLRQTWNVVFSNEVLHNLDVSIKKLDSNWPIIKPTVKPVEQSTKRLASVKQTATDVDSKNVLKPSNDSNITTNGSINKRPESKQNQPKEPNCIRQMDPRKSAPKPPPTPVIRDANFLFRNSNKNVNKKSVNKIEPNSKRKLFGSNASSVKIKKKDSTEIANTSNPMLKKPKANKRKPPPLSQSLVGPAKHSRKSPIEMPVALPVAPDDVIPLGQNHHKSVSKWSKPEVRPLRNESIVSSLKSHHVSPPPNHTGSPPQTISSILPNVTSKTTIPAPNVFVKPEVLFGTSCVDKTSSSQSDWNTTSSVTVAQPALPFVMDRDYRHEFDDVPNQVPITSSDHDVLSQKYEMQPNHQFPPDTHFPSPHSSSLPPQSNMYLGVIEPHGSVKLFINNEMRRLYYLDNITALVLMKVHPDIPFDQLVGREPVSLEPKQVFFFGMSTTVFIDRGQPTEQSLKLEFNHPVPKTFYFAGSPMAHGIMLGLPARELVIDARPYQTAFGGPPIRIYFDSDDQYHTFQISDSRPLLKFSDELRLDLWARLANEAKSNAGFPISPTEHQSEYNYAPNSTISLNSSCNSFPPTTQPSKASNGANSEFSDLNSLLSKLTAVGLIKANTNEGKNVKKPTKSLPSKRYLPLDVSVLKVHHKFVIDQLYSGVPCTNCSLRFSDEALNDEDGKKSRYACHLDWHFRQNRREKTKPGSSGGLSTSAQAHRRPWCYTSDSWILYRDVYDDVEEDSSSFFDKNYANSPSMPSSISMSSLDFSKFKDSISDYDKFIEVIGSDTFVDGDLHKRVCTVESVSDESLNSCSVCNESFDLKWLEDDEEWRLMNAVRFVSKDNGVMQLFHPLCLKDHLIQLDKTAVDTDNSFNYSISINCDNEFGINRKDVIPGLDTIIADNENCDMKEEPLDQESNENVQVKQELEDSVEHIDNSQVDECIAQSIKEEENFDIKVEEFELPIGPISTTTPGIIEESVSVDVAPSVSDTLDGEFLGDKANISKQAPLPPPTQPKRGGIVIKMKRSTPADQQQQQQNIGNVSPTYKTNSTDIQSNDVETKCDTLTDINSDCNKRINILVNDDVGGDEDDDVDIGNGDQEENLNRLDNSCTQANNVSVCTNVSEVVNNMQLDVSSDTTGQQTSLEQTNTPYEVVQLNVDANGVVKVDVDTLLVEQNESNKVATTEKVNFYQKGREESSLCTIM